LKIIEAGVGNPSWDSLKCIYCRNSVFKGLEIWIPIVHLDAV